MSGSGMRGVGATIALSTAAFARSQHVFVPQACCYFWTADTTADLQGPAAVNAAAGGAPSYLPLCFARFLFFTFPLCGAVISTKCGKSYRAPDCRRRK